MNTINPNSVLFERASARGKRAIHLVYYALVLWIPLETLYLIKDADAEGGMTVSKLLGFILFALALLNRRICFRRFPSVFWMVLWYLLVYTLSVLWIPEDLRRQFFAGQTTLVQMIFLFLISLNLFSDTQFRDSLLRFYGWWAVIVAAGMMLGIFGGEFLEDTGRISISALDPNVAAGLLALGAICIVGNIKKLFSKSGIISNLAVSVFIIAILQTGSRGGMIAFIAGVLGFAFCVGKKSRFLARAMVLSAVIGLLGYLVLQAFQTGTVMASRLDMTLRQGDTAGRTIIWGYAWDMFLEKPFLGYGGYNNFVTLGGYLNVSIRNTHNIFLAWLTGVGLVGAVPFIVAFFYTIKKSWNYGKDTGNALPFALMCTLLAINFSISGDNQKLFWIILAVAAASGSEFESSRNSGEAVSGAG